MATNLKELKTITQHKGENEWSNGIEEKQDEKEEDTEDKEAEEGEENELDQNTTNKMGVEVEQAYCHPDAFIPPTKEDEIQAEHSFRKRLAERAARISKRDKMYKEFVERKSAECCEPRIDPNLDEHERPRLEWALEWIEELVNSIETTVLSNVDLSALVDYNPKAPPTSLVPKLPTIVGDCKMVDINNELLLLFVEDAVNELYRGMKDHKPLRYQNAEIDAELEKIWPAHQPHSRDTRHPMKDEYHKAEAEYFHAANLAWGTHHQGVWIPRGRSLRLNSEGDLVGPLITRDTKGGLKGSSEVKAKRAEASRIFLGKIVDTEIALAAFYRAANPKDFCLAQKHRARMYKGLDLQTYSPLQCHTAMARVINKSVVNHKDRGDSRRSMAMWTCFGSFGGADICLASLGETGEKVSFLPDDGIMMRACVIEHAVTPIVGQRGSWVFFSHTKDMTAKEAQKSHEKQAKKKVKEMVNREAELELIRNYQKSLQLPDNSKKGRETLLNQYKVDYVSKNPRKLCKAFILKRKGIRALKNKKKGTPAIEVEELQSRPASLFYVLNTSEKKRWDQGHIPFQRMSRVKKSKSSDSRVRKVSKMSLAT
ncbi:hypothetical protein B7494_g6120 [Chlorociboria aeruginascens]|nr:hypothetical protein B7494_g6120 [Chlorociboria aeruginascens]